MRSLFTGTSPAVATIWPSAGGISRGCRGTRIFPGSGVSVEHYVALAGSLVAAKCGRFFGLREGSRGRGKGSRRGPLGNHGPSPICPRVVLPSEDLVTAAPPISDGNVATRDFSDTCVYWAIQDSNL